VTGAVLGITRQTSRRRNKSSFYGSDGCSSLDYRSGFISHQTAPPGLAGLLYIHLFILPYLSITHYFSILARSTMNISEPPDPSYHTYPLDLLRARTSSGCRWRSSTDWSSSNRTLDGLSACDTRGLQRRRLPVRRSRGAASLVVNRWI